MVTIGKRARTGMLVAAIVGSLFRASPARGDDTGPQLLHFRPMVLAYYFVLSNAPTDTPNHAGGMMLTLPLGVELDDPGLHWKDEKSGRSITVGTLGLYGPGLNWVGLADKRPWYPSVVGALKLSVVQFGFRTRDTKTDDPNPPELQIGVGFLTVLTGEVFNANDNRGSGLSAGWSVNFSITPDAL